MPQKLRIHFQFAYTAGQRGLQLRLITRFQRPEVEMQRLKTLKWLVRIATLQKARATFLLIRPRGIVVDGPLHTGKNT